MELGKMYKINYKGEKWALRKTEKDVEFLKYVIKYKVYSQSG